MCNKSSCRTIFPSPSCANRLKIFDILFSRCVDKTTNYIMQDRPSSTEESSSSEHSPSCGCDFCKEKYGGLPLLAQVVENIQQQEQQNPLDLKIKVYQKPSEVCAPSTSNQTSASTSKSSKIMNCEHCGKNFTHRGDLNKHLRSHTGEQPFVCPMCNRRFTHTSNLARHVRVHSGDRPFRCERCNRDFGRKDKLVMHQKTKLCMKYSQQKTTNE